MTDRVICLYNPHGSSTDIETIVYRRCLRVLNEKNYLIKLRFNQKSIEPEEKNILVNTKHLAHNYSDHHGYNILIYYTYKVHNIQYSNILYTFYVVVIRYKYQISIIIHSY